MIECFVAYADPLSINCKAPCADAGILSYIDAFEHAPVSTKINGWPAHVESLQAYAVVLEISISALSNFFLAPHFWHMLSSFT